MNAAGHRDVSVYSLTIMDAEPRQYLAGERGFLRTIFGTKKALVIIILTVYYIVLATCVYYNLVDSNKIFDAVTSYISYDLQYSDYIIMNDNATNYTTTN
jgi:hypothetical protein